jgi:hypothetical protein
LLLFHVWLSVLIMTTIRVNWANFTTSAGLSLARVEPASQPKDHPIPPCSIAIPCEAVESGTVEPLINAAVDVVLTKSHHASAFKNPPVSKPPASSARIPSAPAHLHSSFASPTPLASANLIQGAHQQATKARAGEWTKLQNRKHESWDSGLNELTFAQLSRDHFCTQVGLLYCV